jgi:hypothetical protein
MSDLHSTSETRDQKPVAAGVAEKTPGSAPPGSLRAQADDACKWGEFSFYETTLPSIGRGVD